MLNVCTLESLKFSNINVLNINAGVKHYILPHWDVYPCFAILVLFIAKLSTAH